MIAAETMRRFHPIALIALVWILSDSGYYFLLPALGVTPDYNNAGMAVALYYVFWVGASVILFWPQYNTWQKYARWNTFDSRLKSLIIWTTIFVGAMYFVFAVLPSLPPFDIAEGKSPPELPLANPWYFLPKTVDILFQQLLVAALVLTLAAEGIGLRRISIVCALLFAASHLLLALGGAPTGYVVRFTVLAGGFGLLFPYLLLRVRNGLAYSYATHWAFYALVIVIARTDFV